MITIFTREFHDFLNSLIAYIVIGVFLMSIGLIMWVLPDINVLDYGYATMEPVFSLGPYLLIFLVPGITMRSFAEEKRNGTLELLLTLPFRIWDVLLGKFLAAWSLVLFSLLPTLLYYFSLSKLGSPPGNLDTSGILGSYIGLLLLGGIFVTIGLLMSILSSNQIVAFILSSLVCYFLFEGIAMLAALDLFPGWDYFVEQLSLNFHYTSMGRGLLTMPDLVYMAGSIVIFLFASRLALEYGRQ